jgi:hypothetical protein
VDACSDVDGGEIFEGTLEEEVHAPRLRPRHTEQRSDECVFEGDARVLVSVERRKLFADGQPVPETGQGKANHPRSAHPGMPRHTHTKPRPTPERPLQNLEHFAKL